MVLPHLVAMLLATAPADGRGLRTAIDSPAVRLDAAQVKARLSASKGEAPPDLSAVDLSGLDLRGVDFRRATLTGARLTDANLGGANLFSCDLTDAVATGVDLNKVAAASRGLGARLGHALPSRYLKAAAGV